jgi:hypothetical protein
MVASKIAFVSTLVEKNRPTCSEAKPAYDRFFNRLRCVTVHRKCDSYLIRFLFFNKLQIVLWQ